MKPSTEKADRHRGHEDQWHPVIVHDDGSREVLRYIRCNRQHAAEDHASAVIKDRRKQSDPR